MRLKTFWNKLKYWQRGATIGFIIYLVFVFLLSLYSNYEMSKPTYTDIIFPFWVTFIIMFVVYTIPATIAGSIIGWIIGRFVKRYKNK